MAVTPKGIVTPDASSPYNLITDLSTLASTTDAAIATQKGTAAQRTAALAGAPAGTLWQDTDGIKMIWRKDGSAWVPAVWRWGGTTAQMNSFTQAPQGFSWYSTTDNSEYVRSGSAWRGGRATSTFMSPINAYIPGGVVTFSRQGNIVTVQGVGRVANSSAISGPTGVNICAIPAGYAPPSTVYAGRMQGSGTDSWYMNVNTTHVEISRYSGTGTNIWLPFYATWSVV